MLDWIEIWEIWRLIQHLKLIFLKRILEALLLCSSMHYPAEASHCHKDILSHGRGEHGLSQCDAVCSDTFLSEPALTVSVICVTVTPL